MRTVFRDITIISPVADSDSQWQIIERGYVVVEGQEIMAVSSGAVPPEISADREVDGCGKVLLPGFVNMHSHAPMTLLRGVGEDLPLERWLSEKIFPAEDRLEDADYYWGGLLAIAEMLLSGTTSFFDMYMGIEQIARAVVESGIRANLARGFTGDVESGKSRLDEAMRVYNQYQGAGDGRLSFSIAPHGSYTCTPELLKLAGKLAGDLGVGIHIHVSETQTENQTVLGQYGKTPTQILAETGLLEHPLLAAHGVHLSDGDIELLAEAGAIVAHCPASNMKLASGIAKLEALRQAGVAVGLGTDGAASNNKLDMYEELRLAGYLQKVSTGNPETIPAGFLLRRATNPVPEGFGMLAPVGRIEPGYQADLQVVDFAKAHLQPVHDHISNLVYAAKGSDVDLVMVAGKVLVDGGELTTIDQEKLLAEVNKRFAKLRV